MTVKNTAGASRRLWIASALALAQLGGISPAQLQQLDAVFDAWVGRQPGPANAHSWR